MPMTPQIETFQPVGHCIYCSRDPNLAGLLSDEHIIPFALGGHLVLPQSSCSDCARSTSAFEAAILRGGFRGIREIMEMPSRNKARPKSLPLFCINGDENAKAMVPVEDYPPTLALPYLVGPLLVDLPGAVTTPKRPWLFAAPVNVDVLYEKYGIRSFATNSVDAGSLARLLAKVALGLTVVQYGADKIEPFVTHIIREDRGFEFRKFVGSLDDALLPSDGPVTHQYQHFAADVNGLKLLVCHLRLFASLGAPSYRVIVGQLKENFDPRCLKYDVPEPSGAEAAAFWRMEVTIQDKQNSNDQPFKPDAFANITKNGRRP